MSSDNKRGSWRDEATLRAYARNSARVKHRAAWVAERMAKVRAAKAAKHRAKAELEQAARTNPDNTGVT